MRTVIAEADGTMLPALLAVENASFTCPWSEESFREAIASDTISVPVCLDEDGNLAGFACLMTVADEGELLNIATAPEFRRNGIAQCLLDRCFALCREKGTAVLYLEVRESNAPARALYRKNGFEEIGLRRNYYEKPRENAVLMRRVIMPDAEGVS